jgi:hypothetical protein
MFTPGETNVYKKKQPFDSTGQAVLPYERSAASNVKFAAGSTPGIGGISFLVFLF